MGEAKKEKKIIKKKKVLKLQFNVRLMQYARQMVEMA